MRERNLAVDLMRFSCARSSRWRKLRFVLSATSIWQLRHLFLRKHSSAARPAAELLLNNGPSGGDPHPLFVWLRLRQLFRRRCTMACSAAAMTPVVKVIDPAMVVSHKFPEVSCSLARCFPSSMPVAALFSRSISIVQVTFGYDERSPPSTCSTECPSGIFLLV